MEVDTITRPHYLEAITRLVDKPAIKVLTGIRRSGKSTLLKQIAEDLARKHTEDSVVQINFDSYEFLDVKTAQDFKAELDKRITPHTRYLVFDEVQPVEEWQKVVNALFASGDYDIYLTGSNSSILSGELATLLTGRYVEIPVQPLTFGEYLLFNAEGSFEDYLRLGGFPAVHAGHFERPEATHLVSDIYDSILVKDIVRRYKIRDLDLFDRVSRFVFLNIGNTFSAQSIANYFKSQHRKVALETIYNYLRYLQEANVIASARRLDLRGKELLKTQEKYYLADHSLLFGQVESLQELIQAVLENIVFNELRFRGYQVHVGKDANREIDFVAIKGREQFFIQVAYKMELAETFEREIAPLRGLRTAHPRMILSWGKTHLGNYDGIQSLYLPDWLLGKTS
jgi:predicted AAA+ superfamily ATPase